MTDSAMMSGWWYGWAITSFVILLLGHLTQKVPQRLGNFWIFRYLFNAGPYSVVMNLMLCAFLWPLMLASILLIALDRDDDDFDGTV